MTKDGKTISKFSKEAMNIGEDAMEHEVILRKVYLVYDKWVGNNSVFPVSNGAPKIMTKFKDKPYSYELLPEYLHGEKKFPCVKAMNREGKTATCSVIRGFVKATPVVEHAFRIRKETAFLTVKGTQKPSDIGSQCIATTFAVYCDEFYEALICCCWRAGIQIKAGKVKFGVKSITFHNYVISEHGTEPKEANLCSIRNMSSPKDIHQIRAFLGCSQQLSHYIKDYGIIAKPLHNITKKGAKCPPPWIAGSGMGSLEMKEGCWSTTVESAWS